jgi:cytosine/adenosine deaminase-related metal-dependent hydrolase
VSEAIGGRVVIVAADSAIRRDAVVRLDDGRVADVRDGTPAAATAYDIVMPGLIDGHSHARGVPLDRHGIGQGPLERFLVEVRALTPLSQRDEALVAADAALASGITAAQVIHHDFGGLAAYGRGARAIAEGFAAAGIRAFITLGLTDQDEYTPAGGGPCSSQDSDLPVPSRGVTPGRFPALASRLLGEHGLVSIDGVGPVAPQWCSDQALRAIAAVPGARRVHAHLLESARQRLAPDPVARLEQAGLLSAASSFAHGVWLDSKQMARLARAGASVVHCPGSNARLGVGTCPVRRLLDAGVSTALGLDSNGAAGEPDMFAEMRQALRTAEAAGEPLTAVEVLALATTGGARVLARSDLGTLRPGAAADVVAVNLPGAAEAADPVAHLIEHGSPRSVAGTWIAGQRTERSMAAAKARARLAAALRRDGPARRARLAEARTAWETVGRAWQAAEGCARPAASTDGGPGSARRRQPGSTAPW